MSETLTDAPAQAAASRNLSQTPAAADAVMHAQIEVACHQACQTIAPTWPLDRAIAVNPHWSRIGMPLRRVAARMAALGGIHVFPPRDRQRRAWQAGRIDRRDLELALGQLPDAAAAGLTVDSCTQALHSPPVLQQLPLLIDVLDNDPKRHARLSWRQAITHQVSQTCAAYFDEHQADWQPERSQGLYAFWRDTLTHDHSIGLLMGVPHLGRALDALPATRQDAERWVMKRLGLPPAVWADYLEAVLLTVNGWASWCAYLGWQARLQGRDDAHLRDLLAIRLAWGVVLLDGKDDVAATQAFVALQQAWREAPAVLEEAEQAMRVDEVWQLALEIGYQRTLARRLLAVGGEPTVRETAEVQAAFCIDVRSEPVRRAIEAVWPGVQTIGFAGFFGLPVAYTPLATLARRPQLPGLLAPTMEVVDGIVSPSVADRASDAVLQEDATRSRQSRLALADQWRAASRWPGAAFSFVEAVGLGYLGQLGRWLLPTPQERARDDLAGLPARYRPVCRPQVVGLDLEAKIGLAARVLHAMGLDQQLAPLVLLVGHGSQSANNAHAAALDCGACCGQTGEVNARSLAQLLNEPAVRLGLQARGITIPESTWFVAALHNTTTDEIEGLDLDLLPESAMQRWERLQAVFAQAGDQVRRERAPQLGLDPRTPHGDLLDQLRRRASDGAQTRPEWGLAGNAAFVIAPRQRSLGAVLEGRSFLHDYDASQDADGSVLELLMTAPMLVTHWINWQYHASTCDPARLGSGNKVLHNVVGGNLGVFEGNGGDLRIGLSQQSLHDGERWVHEPLRLTVVIDAPQAAIEAGIGKHAVVRQLLDNGWLHLWRFDPAGLLRYERGEWQPLQLEMA
ncbi:MAG: DUF2309 domain-containing protein [Burkholderiales bacterium PBB1]|nr:MAG: DUF2309 domain-containing protein [Burkholderiales bacterium PBB1]